MLARDAGTAGRHDEGARVQGESEAIPEGRVRPARGRGRIFVILVGLACLLVVAAWIAYGRQAMTQLPAKGAGVGQPARTVPGVVAPARTGDLGAHLTAPRSVPPLNTATVIGRVDSQLLPRRLPEG